MIPCTWECIYQDVGICSLHRATTFGNAPDLVGDCAYAVGRREAMNRVLRDFGAVPESSQLNATRASNATIHVNGAYGMTSDKNTAS